MRKLVAIAIAGSLSAIATGQSPAETSIDARTLRALDPLVVDVARLGRAVEASELVLCLEEFGATAEALDALRSKVESALERGRPDARRLGRAADQLARWAERAAKSLPENPDEHSVKPARVLLRIDGDLEAARRVLGHVEDAAGIWRAPDDVARRERWVAISDAMRRARALELDVTVDESADAPLARELGRPAVRVSTPGLEVHSSWSEPRARRLVENVARAAWLSDWLLHGDAGARPRRPVRCIQLDDEPMYQRLWDADVEAGRAPPRRETQLATGAYYRKDGTLVVWDLTERNAFAGLVGEVLGVSKNMLDGKRRQACLIDGHVNWLLMAFLGAELPNYVSVEEGRRELPGTATERRVREEMEILRSAGLFGARSWLRYLAERGEDPPFARSFVGDVAAVDGENLLKATIVAEFMHLEERMADVVEGTTAAVEKPAPEIVEAFERALNEPLATFERRWRAWILGHQLSIVERLRGVGATAAPGADEQEALEYLQSIRSALVHITDVVTIGLDLELSRAARLHAEYLERHPDQAAAWPDAHEEYTDREGFTPDGAWAGAHSVIAPGVRGAKEAIDSWMGTFYHRLPLIDPGVVRIGYGQHGRTAVLDASSLCRPPRRDWAVLWPAPDAKDVPTRFAPELPNPFPGEDQSTWGYPITIQLGVRVGGVLPRLTFELRDGGDVVECRVTSPHEPGNPKLVPPNAYCAIPTRALKPGTTYTVRAASPDGTWERTWTFRTGRR